MRVSPADTLMPTWLRVEVPIIRAYFNPHARVVHGKLSNGCTKKSRVAVAGRLADSVRRVDRSDARGKLRLQWRRLSDIGNRDRRFAFDAKVAMRLTAVL